MKNGMVDEDPLVWQIGMNFLQGSHKLPLLLQDFKTNTGHGKLLLDDSLYPEAYATNVNEQVYTPPSVMISALNVFLPASRQLYSALRASQ